MKVHGFEEIECNNIDDLESLKNFDKEIYCAVKEWFKYKNFKVEFIKNYNIDE